MVESHVAAANKFGSCRLFHVDKDESEFNAINVYVAKKGSNTQTEWNLGKVASHIWNFSGPKDWKKKMSHIMEAVKTTHSKIWCARPVPMLYESKTGGNKRKRSQEDVGEQLFAEKTIPTSMLFALLVTVLTQGKRQPKDRIKGIMFLHCLIDKVCALSDGRQTAELLRGTMGYGSQQVHAELANNGTLLGPLWDRALEQGGQLESLWNHQLCDTRCPWVTSAFSEPHIADVICFCLMATPPSTRRRDANVLNLFRNAMTEPVYFLVGFIARQVESNMISITVPPKNLSRKIGRASKIKARQKRLDRSSMGEIIAEAVHLLYDGQAPRLKSKLETKSRLQCLSGFSMQCIGWEC